ncbi:HelD family protein [Companilactobacillus nodensis]|uniref:Superfamily I DNA and RNA helicase-like protein n=1 Tax=Companilactobacillus nodensis DSM 19682 = JCM 14932 = NBRC 107160 TaxID=1423775 RepID=A0A0R1KLQ0_9LACO|nr:UvrD-helicase domain-containing protein [Companilactobacillus nodensis]KRK80938.1 superfamily I DNA and RNA helicase-like protein [Companilactobacillus nodensis DSM 19682 = JCM 14932 = NBRC 107160]
MDNTFESEQAHLSLVHQTLQNTLDNIDNLLSDNADTAKNFKKGAGKETALNFDSYADNLDTFAAIETMNKQIDYYNNKQTQLQNTKSRVTRLLPAPYFARIDLQYPDETEAIPFYIGAAGFSPTPEEPMVLDWRSPIADLYYNNKIGKTYYIANDRKININVDTRRQFLLHDDVLEDIFDTDVAIQDPLLVKTLQENKNNQMGSITATIQKEQNVIIRDTKSSALLVNGIAGSGKTSVVLQRIAYLLYRYRDILVSNDVLLLTPNTLFTNYINQVLPSLGEEAPLQMTFEQLLEQFSANQLKSSTSHVQQLAVKLDELDLVTDDFRNIKLNGETIFSQADIKNLFDQTPDSLVLSKRITALTTVMVNQIEDNIERDSKNGKVQAELSDLTDTQQDKIFGKIISPNSDIAFQRATKKMLQWKHKKLLKQLEQKSWLNITQIIKSVLKVTEINQLDYAYTRLKLLNLVQKRLKFAMVDEIQDYSMDQILFLITAFPNAKWTLVGDQFQSIREVSEPLTFDDLKTIFEQHKIKVTKRNLYTSYRSSGTITEAFVKHGSPELINEINTVQVGGKKPEYIENNDTEELMTNLKLQINDFDDDELSAIVTSNSELAQSIHDKIKQTALSNDTERLPANGIVVLQLTLAKGLEFDNVIVADINADYYKDARFGENRIYTAFSRASKTLIVNSIKNLD